MNKRLLHITLFIIALSAKNNLYSQCAMCRAVLESEEGQRTAEGVNNGITYLMVIPYILVAFVGYMVFKNRK